MVGVGDEYAKTTTFGFGDKVKIGQIPHLYRPHTGGVEKMNSGRFGDGDSHHLV